MYVLCIMMEIGRDESSERQGQRSGLLEREKRGRERERVEDAFLCIREERERNKRGKGRERWR